MAEPVTVARPYAEAIFRTAREKNALGPVSEMLAFLAAVANDEQMRSALGNPKLSAAQKKELILAIGGDRLSQDVKNLTGILVDNHRESLFGHIAVQFEDLKHESEKVLRAKITSAQPLSDAQRTDLVSALERQYGRKVEAELDVDQALLGGARVQVGDLVIHASVRDSLAQMAAALAR